MENNTSTCQQYQQLLYLFFFLLFKLIKGIKIIAPVNIKDPKDEDKMIPAKPMKMARRDKEFLLDIL